MKCWLNSNRRLGWLGALILVLANMLVGCMRVAKTLPPNVETQPIKEVDLSFETIGKSDIGGGELYSDPVPKLVIITGIEDVQDVANTISSGDQEQLKSLDFNHSMAIAVFQGIQSTGSYGVEIQRITRADNTIKIYTLFHVPQPGYGRASILTSPYQIIKIEKSGDYGKEFEFVLIGEILLTEKHFVP